MNDWKKDVDGFLEAKAAENLRLQQERKEAAQAEEERKRQEAQEQIQAEMGEKKKNLAKFTCHICGVSSNKPRHVGTRTESYGGSGSYDMPGTSTKPAYNDWSLPGDLYKCSQCNQWLCEDHIYRGICQKCAEKL